jgi:hypothetical protein
MSRSVVFLVLVATLCTPVCSQAQRTRFGFAVGKSFVGGGDSRTLVDVGDFNVTGADQTGFHIRAFAEVPVSSPGFVFRGELFYNRLHSRPNSWAIVGSGTGAAALFDRTIGLTGSFIGSLRPSARVSPYFVLGAGAFLSSLGTNPDPQSSQVILTRSGMGLGLQTGFGLRVRMGQRDFLVEWRYSQAMNNTRGAGFMPLTVGIVF